MRYSTAVIGVAALLASEVAAFPAAAIEYAAKSEREPESMAKLLKASEKFEAMRPRDVGFDAEKQYVSNKGKYAFVAPNLAGGDIRGPCPGLNAMANHNYLPHNGVATIDQFVQGTYDVFGMGKDLGGFLAIYGSIFDGDLTKWSIGGKDTSMLFGDGLSGSHNKYEGDASPTRPDLYQYGNNYKVVMSQWDQLFNTQPDPATANYDLDVLTDFRALRFQQSIDENKYFFNGPFSGVLVQPAAYTFIFRFMGNKSAEYPEGTLNQETLKSFFSITGEAGNHVYTEGWEAIPDNWYKRAIGDEYTIPFFLADVIAAAAKYPQFLNIGGNTGTTNSFTLVDVTNLTGGLLNAVTLLEGNNALCFAFQSLQNAVPDLVKDLGDLLNGLLHSLGPLIGGAVDTLSCTKLDKYSSGAFEPFPGAQNLIQ